MPAQEASPAWVLGPAQAQELARALAWVLEQTRAAERTVERVTAKRATAVLD
jgi:hypothetical protein